VQLLVLKQLLQVILYVKVMRKLFLREWIFQSQLFLLQLNQKLKLTKKKWVLR